MTSKVIEAMLREDADAWAELTALLDAHPSESLHDPASPLWTSRDVYAHLARWMEHSASVIKALLVGRQPPEMAGMGDEINARWQREDAQLSLQEARQWARHACEERRRTIEAVPSALWGGEIEKYARFDGVRHLKEHLSYITLTDERHVPIEAGPAQLGNNRGGGMYEIAVERFFDAAHFLRGYRGKCEAVHGHRYRVVVRLGAEKLNDIGLAYDFTDLKRHLDGILARFDHVLLNDVPPFDKINPSAENIAMTIFDELKARLAGEPIMLAAVEAWETPHQGVVYRPGK